MANAREDVLGDVLSLSLLRSVVYERLEARAPWGLSMPDRTEPRGRGVLYVMVGGKARLELASRGPVFLEAGQVVFLPHGDAHVLRDSESTVPALVHEGGISGKPGKPATISSRTSLPPISVARRIGGRGALTSVVIALVELDRAPPQLLDRPAEAVVLPGDPSLSDPRIAATIDLILAELKQPGPASVLLLQRLADVLVVQAMRSLTKQHVCEAQRRPGLAALSDPPIHHALSLLHAHVSHPWTVAQLASRVGLSRSGFAARFTELVGEPPLHYLARWRVARAAELLRETNEAVGAVADRVGYDSVPSFNKAFKRWLGTTPGSYRKADTT